MREVSQFVVIFPGRFIGSGREEWKLLLRAIRAEYPQYTFEVGNGHNLDEDFKVIPVVGTIGGGVGVDPEEIYMCKPLDPRVIPALVSTLQTYEAIGAAFH